MNIPKCPHCKYEFNDDDIWSGNLDTNDGCYSETDCPRCNEKLYIVCEYEPNFYMIDKEDYLGYEDDTEDFFEI